MSEWVCVHTLYRQQVHFKTRATLVSVPPADCHCHSCGGTADLSAFSVALPFLEQRKAETDRKRIRSRERKKSNFSSETVQYEHSLKMLSKSRLSQFDCVNKKTRKEIYKKYNNKFTFFYPLFRMVSNLCIDRSGNLKIQI